MDGARFRRGGIPEAFLHCSKFSGDYQCLQPIVVVLATLVAKMEDSRYRYFKLLMTLTRVV